MRIEILGPGCSRCFATERHVKHALDVLQLRADVVHLHDPKEYAKYGVLFTPGVVVDGAVKLRGKNSLHPGGGTVAVFTGAI